MDTVTTVEKETRVGKFTIEADGPRNNMLIIQCIPGCVLRSRLDPTRTVKDSKTGEEMMPIDQARALSALPKLPGMRLEVDPAKLTYKVSDPLQGDHKLLYQLKKRLSQSKEIPSKLAERFDGMPDEEGTLDAHSMKSLVWELWHIVDAGEAKLVRGVLPKTKDEIEKMKGKRLLNPGARVPNTQPRYVEDYEAWIENLSTRGG